MYLNAIREGFYFLTSVDEDKGEIYVPIDIDCCVKGELGFSRLHRGVSLDQYSPFGDFAPSCISGRGYATALEYEVAKVLSKEFCLDDPVFLLATSSARKRQLNSRGISPNSVVSFSTWLSSMERKMNFYL